MWAIETYTICDGWVNCWHEDDEPMVFDTPEEAVEELMDHINCLNEAGMDYNPLEFRLTKAAPEETISP